MRLAAAWLFISLVCLTSASATVVDWGTLTWPDGSLSNSFDIDPSHAGNDITVTVSGDTAQLQPSLAAGNPQTPAITRAFDGGLSPGHSTLELALNLANNTQAVTVTVTFAAGYANQVSNVSFNLFDIDFANSGGSTYQDSIRSISATSTTGSTIAPTITNLGANVSLAGAGLLQTLTGTASNPDTGAGSGTGNATITFNATGIDSFTFTYGGTGLFANPTYQHIGLDNIDFSIVPEMNPAWFCLFFCGALVVSTSVRRCQLWFAAKSR